MQWKHVAFVWLCDGGDGCKWAHACGVCRADAADFASFCWACWSTLQDEDVIVCEECKVLPEQTGQKIREENTIEGAQKNTIPAKR